MKKIGIFILLCFFASIEANAQTYQLFSPDKTMLVTLSIADQITYAVTLDGNPIIDQSSISFVTSLTAKSSKWKIAKGKKSFHNKPIIPVFPIKTDTIQNQYNQISLEFTNDIVLEFRIFNNGVAWRWLTNHKGEYTILNELIQFKLTPDTKTLFPLEDQVLYSHHERIYIDTTLAGIGNSKNGSLPALFVKNRSNVVITESNLLNYPGFYLETAENGIINGILPRYPKSCQIVSDRDEKVIDYENFIAKCMGKEDFPWRVIVIEREDKKLLDNQLVFQLADEPIGDFNWVKPGKVAWDWWNANNIYQVPFEAGINTETYKYYIDFAAQNNLDYIILDEGWSETTNLLHVVPEINMQELTQYAAQKGVGVILWASWIPFRDHMTEVLDQFEKWGIKGVKIDFMQRDDQPMVQFYVKAAQETAKRHMIVDFHGAFKPTGLIRTYPNVLSYEGVYGLEQSKWDPKKRNGPEQNLKIPFTRMVAGPMDYTPGAMINAQANDWQPHFRTPMSLGTRCHQLAMYVIYESPLQMLADSPTHYYKEPECLLFLKEVPTIWTQTIPLEARVGKYILMAKKAKDGKWFVGAMADWSERDLILNLHFLAPGKYKITIWKDGLNANHNGNDYLMETIAWDSNNPIPIHLAKGGGWCAIIEPITK
ncbi:MAG: glycoside hydrolase family 97 protein [Bacteroidetes bacterium]|nr:glycoside hydrolase family 97 protein [Bacteroidota bacterium]